MDYMQNGQLPLGLAMGLGMNTEAMNRFGSMSEAEKEDLIFKARDAKTKEEMERIINSLSEEAQKDADFPTEIFQGPSIG